MTHMNNLLKVAMTHESYTHIMLKPKEHGSSHHIYLGAVMDDHRLHEVLDALLEEFEYPEMDEPITVYQQANGKLEEYVIDQYCVND